MGDGYMGFERLPDTPWHMGYVKKEQQDPRRHKSRCIYLKSGNCECGKSGAYKLKCPGSSHCKFYAESEEMAAEVYLQTRTVEEERTDNFQDYLFNGKANLENRSLKENFLRFSGVETIRLKDIKLPKSYKEWKPNPKDVNDLLDYYEKYKKMDKPIILEIIDGKYYLRSGYLQYYVSKKLNKTWIRSKLETETTKKKNSKKK